MKNLFHQHLLIFKVWSLVIALCIFNAAQSRAGGVPGSTTTNTSFQLVLTASGGISSSYVGLSESYIATVTDEFGNPAYGVYVNFVVTGANPSVQSYHTDRNGLAVHAVYTNNTGVDHIVATLEGYNSATAAIDLLWKPAQSCSPSLSDFVDYTLLCQGDNWPLSASPGVSYLWSNGATTPNITVTTSGAYYVTVTDENNCVGKTNTVVYSFNPLPAKPTISASSTTLCYGSSITLYLDNPEYNTNYYWSNGEVGNAATVYEGGTYYVTADGQPICQVNSDPITIYAQNCSPNCSADITPSGPLTFCAGGSVDLVASPGQTYMWSNGERTQSIHVVNSGMFNVTVMDDNLCTATTGFVTVTVYPVAVVPTISAAGPVSFCSGGSVILTASTVPNATYLWSNGATTQSITVTNSGTYSVYARNASTGCGANSNSIAVTVTNCGNTYCSAGGSSNSKGFIANAFACYGFNNTTGFSGYANYSGKSVTSANGKILGFSVTPGYTGAVTPLYVKAWIDWNGDGDFQDANEDVFDPSTPITVKTKFWVKVPFGTAPGTKGMRLSLRSDRLASDCGMFANGEVEDYTVNIAAARFAAPDATDNAFDQAGDQFTVYPNPVRGRMIIERSGYSESKASAAPAQMTISNINGQVVMKSTLNSLVQAIDVSKLANGIYFVSIINANNKTTQKIIVNH